MATVTTIGHINNAIRFTQKIGNIYVGIGLGGTSKPNDTISNLYGLRRAEMVSLARMIEPSENFSGSYVTYGGNKYELISQNDAYKKNAHFIYIKASLAADEINGNTYDTVGVYTYPKFKQGVTGDVIPISAVDSPGYLEMYDSREPIDRSNLKITEQFIIEA